MQSDIGPTQSQSEDLSGWDHLQRDLARPQGTQVLLECLSNSWPQGCDAPRINIHEDFLWTAGYTELALRKTIAA